MNIRRAQMRTPIALAPIALVLAIVSIPSMAQHARRWQQPGVAVPQPIAPSSLPDGFRAGHGYDYGYGYGYGYDRDGFLQERAIRTPCIARYRDAERDDASSDMSADQDRQIIDWCALPPFEPRYAPQIPAEWRWRRGFWQEGRRW